MKATSAIWLWCLFRWTSSVGAAKFALVIYTFYSCCDVAYVSYIFDKVPKDHFLTASSLTCAGQLTGRFIKVLIYICATAISDVLFRYLFLVAHIVALLIAAIFLNFSRTQSSRSTSRNIKLNQHAIFYSIWYIVSFGIVFIFISLENILMEPFRYRQHEVSKHLWKNIWLR